MPVRLLKLISDPQALIRLTLLFLLSSLLISCRAESGTSVETLVSTEPPPTLIPISEGIKLAWFYKPPGNGDLRSLYSHFDTFILTKNDEPQRDALKDMGLASGVLQYLRLDAIQDPGSCTAIPFQNQVANQPGDFCQISAEHDDWFMLDPDGNRIVYDGYYMMDPSNQGWREFWLERAELTQNDPGWDGIFLDNYLERAHQSQQLLRWDGVFLDNVDASTSIFATGHSGETGGMTHELYQQGVEGFLEYISRSYFEPRNLPVYANLVGVEEDETWFRYLQFVDGVMAETWAVDWQNRYHSTEDWNRDLNRIERTMQMGKNVILVAQGDRDDLERQSFAFASYLLIADSLASFRYANYDAYDEIWLYDNYSIELGAPLGPRYYDNGEWQRDFEHGHVSVDPFFHVGSIEPNATPTG